MYDLTDVTKTYRRGDAAVRALEDVTMRIDEGEFLAIQGPTGHGTGCATRAVSSIETVSTGSCRT